MPTERSQVAGKVVGTAAFTNEAERCLLNRIPSGLRLQVGFLRSIASGNGFLPKFSALEPDVVRQARCCEQQRSDRDEKANH